LLEFLLLLLSVPVVFAGIVLIVLVILILIVIYLRGKTVVTVPSISLVLEKDTYDHGDTVNASGVVKSDVDKPAEGETVDLTLKDSSGKEFAVGTVVTDAEGKYETSFAVPGDVASGGVDVIAEDKKLGVTATRSFTLLR
jgi:hypothetical protein